MSLKVPLSLSFKIVDISHWTLVERWHEKSLRYFILFLIGLSLEIKAAGIQSCFVRHHLHTSLCSVCRKWGGRARKGTRTPLEKELHEAQLKSTWGRKNFCQHFCSAAPSLYVCVPYSFHELPCHICQLFIMPRYYFNWIQTQLCVVKSMDGNYGFDCGFLSACQNWVVPNH